jgi:transmembrane sensor
MEPEAFSSGADSLGDGAADEAAAWLSRRDRGLSFSERGEFRRWMSVPAHAQEFARIESAWRSLNDLRRDPSLAEMARELDEATRPRSSRRLAAFGALAAAAAMALVFLWLRPSRTANPGAAAPAESLAYRVVPSAAHTMTLSDGSLVDLRADGEVTTDFTQAVRRLRLVRGEANFKVTKNTARPFIVSVGNVAVRAVGTAFDIQFGKDQVDVVVTEGKVTVEDLGGVDAPPAVPLLVAGQRAVIYEDGPPGSRPRAVVDSITPTQIDQVLAWRSTWLVFDRTPLDKAVEAFNGRGPNRIVLGDPSLASRRLGGMFRADNMDGFVRLLEQGLDVRSERRGENEIVLLPATR